MNFLQSAPTGTYWWILAALLVLGELGTGTFYLLMLGLGAAAGALAAMAGLGSVGQLLAAAAVGGGAVAAWHLLRSRQPQEPTAGNKDVHIDVGATVVVSAWDPQGWTTVSYRGSMWRARWTGSGSAEPGVHRISGLEGNHLLLITAD